MYLRRVEDSPFRRTGIALGIAVGASGCSGNKDWCRGTNYFAFNVADLSGNPVGVFATESRPGPSFMVEVGYRPVRLVEVVGFAQSAYRPQQVNVPDGAVVDEVNAFDIGGGLAAMIRPLAYSRFDPFVGVGLGGALHRVRLRLTSDEDIERTYEERISRLLVRASAGLNVYVIERLSVGPRFDYDFFAAGQVCTDMQRVDPSGESTSSRECQSARELDDLVEVDGFKGPAGQLPQFWRVSLDLRTYF